MTVKHLLLFLAGVPALPTFGADPLLMLTAYRHGLCPYVLPAETNLEEILRVKRMGYSAVGVGFCGPYNGGNIDWSTLDQAIASVADATTRVVLHVFPRFYDWEGIADTLDTGEVIAHRWDRNPNYSMLDVFDPAQRRTFCDYLARTAERYGRDERVIAFIPGWGYQGETGFYNGDFNTRFELLGSTCAGYSNHALREYNAWRRDRGLSVLAQLPRPSPVQQSEEFIDWMRFRYWFVGEVAQRDMVDALRAYTERPIGIFGYLPASPESYARAWTFTPNADFFRSAGSAASFDLSRTLIDSAIGWEDAWLHQGTWDYTFACMRRDEIRQIARGGTFHGMWARVYETEPQWEPDIYTKVSDFLLHQDIASQVVRASATVALFQPTWATAALPSRSTEALFLPSVAAREFIAKMTGLVESFGLPYVPIWEQDLLEAQRLAHFAWIVLPLADFAPRFLGAERAAALLADSRVLPIPLQDGVLSRSVFRALLRTRGVPVGLDYDDESIVAGRSHNVIYNWTPQPRIVRVPDGGRFRPLTLDGHGCVFLPDNALITLR